MKKLLLLLALFLPLSLHAQTGSAKLSKSLPSNNLTSDSAFNFDSTAPVTVLSGGTLTWNSGATALFSPGSTVNATGATLIGFPFGTGTVSSFSSGTLSPLFTTTVANPTTTPALSFMLSNAASGAVFGNPTSASAVPSYSQLSAFSVDARGLNINNQTLVAVGDSITYGANTSGSGQNPYPAPSSYLLSQASFFANHLQSYSSTTNGSTSSGATTIVLTSATGFAANQFLNPITGLAPGTRITSISSNTLTVSPATTGTISSGTAISTFSYYNAGANNCWAEPGSNSGNNIAALYAANVKIHRPTANGGDGGAAAWIVLLIGVNDLQGGRSPSQVEGDIASYIATAHGDGFKVAVCTLLPSPEYGGWAVNTLNNLILTGQTGGDLICNTNSCLNNAYDTYTFNTDLLHPTAAGQAAMGEYDNSVFQNGGDRFAVDPVQNSAYQIERFNAIHAWNYTAQTSTTGNYAGYAISSSSQSVTPPTSISAAFWYNDNCAVIGPLDSAVVGTIVNEPFSLCVNSAEVARFAPTTGHLLLGLSLPSDDGTHTLQVNGSTQSIGYTDTTSGHTNTLAAFDGSGNIDPITVSTGLNYNTSTKTLTATGGSLAGTNTWTGVNTYTNSIIAPLTANLGFDARTANLNGQSFVFEGDSITYGFNLSSPTTQCFGYLASLMPFFAGHGTYFNDAVNGSTIAPGTNGGNNISDRYVANVKPYRPAANGGSGGPRAYLFLLIGTNDIANLGYNATSVIAALNTYIAQAQSDGFTVILGTLTPRTGSGWTFTNEGNLELVNQAIRAGVNGASGSSVWIPSSGVLDYNQVLSCTGAAGNDITYYSDGLHPNAMGHQILANYVNSTMSAGTYSQPRSAPWVVDEQLDFTPWGSTNGLIDFGSNQGGTAIYYADYGGGDRVGIGFSNPILDTFVPTGKTINFSGGGDFSTSSPWFSISGTAVTSAESIIAPAYYGITGTASTGAGGAAGAITLTGGSGGSNSLGIGGPGGNIYLNGGNAATTGQGGEGGVIDLVGGNASGSTAGGNGGSIIAIASGTYSAGSLNLNSNGSSNGGNISTIAGGSLTMGTGTLTGPSTTGTIALTSQLISTPVSVANGGTGTTTLGSGQILVGAGTSAVTTSSNLTYYTTGSGGTQSTWMALNANSGIPFNVGEVVNKQGALAFNAHFDGTNWVYDSNGFAGAFRLNSAGSGSNQGFQLCVVPSGTSGATISAMDSTDIGLIGLSAQNFIFNPGTNNPSLGSHATLAINPNNTVDNTTAMQINCTRTTDTGLVIQGAASQSATLQEWQTNGGSVLASISSAGAGTFAGVTDSVSAKTLAAAIVYQGAGTLSGGTATFTVPAGAHPIVMDTNTSSLTNVGSLGVSVSSTTATVKSTNVLDTSTFSYFY